MYCVIIYKKYKDIGNFMNRIKLYNILLFAMLICLVLSGIFSFLIIKSYVFKVFFLSFLLISFTAFFQRKNILTSSESTLSYSILVTIMSILILSFILCISFILGRATINHIFKL